jgi:hypothetical protein
MALVELTEEQKQLQLIERARKRHEAYERQKARQRQMRHERGLKPLGRPQRDAVASCRAAAQRTSHKTNERSYDE